MSTSVGNFFLSETFDTNFWHSLIYLQMFSGYEPFIPVLHLYYIVLYALFVSVMFHF